jgi:ElaB/YqjD/DUF883 family membrane-anchored ribosome-binding protein
MAEKQQNADGAGIGAAPAEPGDAAGRPFADEAAEALERLRTVLDQASQTVRELTEASRQWAEGVQSRAAGLRGQGERAIETVSRQVENNLVASIAIAAAVGFLAGFLARR